MTMKLFSRPLFFPVILAVSIFIIDKLFLFECVRENTVQWSRFEAPLYESKKLLYRNLQKQHPADNIIVSGSSRSGELSQQQFYDLLKNSQIRVYNFSAPLASYEFHYYWLKKMLTDKIKIRAVILEIDPVLFSMASSQYTFQYSLDIPFVLHYTDLSGFKKENPYLYEGGFSSDDLNRYLLMRIFAAYRYSPDFINVLKNNTPEFPKSPDEPGILLTGKDLHNEMKKLIVRSVNDNLGGMRNPTTANMSMQEISKDAERKFSELKIDSKNPSLIQTAFFNKTIKLLSSNKIPTILFFPLNSESFQRLLDEKGHSDVFRNEINQIADEAKKNSPE